MGSVDVKIEEIPEGSFRVKIIGTVVNLTTTTITLNDGTGTVTLNLGNCSVENLAVKTLGRFLCDITNSGTTLVGEVILWHEMPRELVDKYWKLVQIERRVPR